MEMTESGVGRRFVAAAFLLSGGCLMACSSHGGAVSSQDGAGAVSGTADAGHVVSGSGGSSNMPQSHSPGCGATDYPPAGAQALDVNGLSRDFIVALPPGYDPNTPHTLVFAWHGQLGTKEQIANTGFYGLKSRAGDSTIFVSAQGLYTSTGISGTGWDNQDGRDIAFTRAMLDFLRSNYCVDDARIFSVGMSYGGVMSNNVGCALGDVFRAIATMAGVGPINVGACVGQVAVWDAYGDADPIVPAVYIDLGRTQWTNANHCAQTTTPYGNDGCVSYDGCDAGYPVVWCSFAGGHVVPSFAPDEIWSFFSQF